eukprot:TRINITY_DN5588_c0_g1_i2.p1 TRINITY_DN5588_c0_g1~~TRINITY_DN5588_c0_g1_i2.p1  ORF type:complete len:968 (+),score=172.92 TRINITY_DN5588_c0_g1_i2:767-3670(+)
MFMQRGGFGGVGCGMFHYSGNHGPQAPAGHSHSHGTMPAGPFGCTCGAYMHEEEYYDSSDGEPGEASHRYVRENYHAHEEAARRSEQRSRQIFEERRANAAISKLARPKMQARTDTTLTVAWSAPGRVDVSHYELECRENDTEWQICASVNVTSAVVPRLRPSTQYHFRVRGCKDDKFGDWSAESSYKTSGSARSEKKDEKKAEVKKEKVEPKAPAKPTEKEQQEQKKTKKAAKEERKEKRRQEEEAAAKKAEETFRKKAIEEEKRKEEAREKEAIRQEEEAEQKLRDDAARQAKKDAKKAARQARKAQEQQEQQHTEAVVPERPAAASQEPSSSCSQEELIFQLCLQLEDMGFTDRARNQHFLQNNRCDLAATIDALIASTVSDSAPPKPKNDWTTSTTRKQKKASDTDIQIPPPAHPQPQPQQLQAQGQRDPPQIPQAKPCSRTPEIKLPQKTQNPAPAPAENRHNWNAAVPKPSGGVGNAWASTKLPTPNPAPGSQDHSFPPLGVKQQRLQQAPQVQQKPAQVGSAKPTRHQPTSVHVPPQNTSAPVPAVSHGAAPHVWRQGSYSDDNQPGPAVENDKHADKATCDERLLGKMLWFMGMNQSRHQPFIREVEEMVSKMFPDRSVASCYPKYGSMKACLHACAAQGLVELGGKPPMDWVRLVNGAVANSQAGMANGLNGHSVAQNQRDLGASPAKEGRSELDPTASTFVFTPVSRQASVDSNGWDNKVPSQAGPSTWISPDAPVGAPVGTWSDASGMPSGQPFGSGGHTAPAPFVQSRGMFAQPSQPSMQAGLNPQWDDSAGEGQASWGGAPQAKSSSFVSAPGLFPAAPTQPVAQPTQFAAPQGAGLWGSTGGLGGSWGGSAPPLPAHTPMFGDSLWGGFGPGTGLASQPSQPSQPSSSQESTVLWSGTDPELSSASTSGQEDASWNQVESDLAEMLEGPESPVVARNGVSAAAPWESSSQSMW